MRYLTVVISSKGEDFIPALREGHVVGTNVGYGLVEKIEDGHTFIGRFNPSHLNGSGGNIKPFEPIRIKVDPDGLFAEGSMLYFRGNHVKVKEISSSEINSIEQKLNEAGL